jgi:crotonobetaine/carnitine-CoA ligase
MLHISAYGALAASAGGPGDVYLVWEPLYHIGGAQVLLLPLLEDVRLALVPKLSISRFWRQAADLGATHVHYLGGILQMLLNKPVSAAEREHGIRVAWGGGCTERTFDEASARFGFQIRETYGMTEGSSIATASDGESSGTVGKPLPWFQVRIVDPAGQDVPVGEQGEIVLRSSLTGAIFDGYLNNDEATSEARRGDALYTHDLGSMDEDGQLHFHGRLTDSLRCRGENVSAWEIEHVANEHPDVDSTAVIGVKSELGEEEIKLFVQPRQGAQISPLELSRWLEPKLAKYQWPRYIALVSGFERTPSERIRKHLLTKETHDSWDREQHTE